MDFEKKYPILQRPNEAILVQWTRGYKEVELYFNDKLIGSVSGASKLKKGIVLLTDVGIIKLKLSEKPITLDLIVDGYHSPINVSHPFKELKKSATFFWMITVFAVFGSLLEGMSFGLNGIGMIVTSFNVIVVGLYITSSICVSKGMAWAYFLGLSLYSLMTFFALLTLPVSGLFGILAFLVRIALLYFIITNAKHATQTLKHKKYTSSGSENLLDSKI